jgi:hypothetical protein
MNLIPAALLQKLYVLGSLRNTANGFEFALHNTLAPMTIDALGPLQVDDMRYAAAAISVRKSGQPRSALQISSRTRLDFPINGMLHIQVTGRPLADGKHRLSLAFHTREVGELVMEVADTVVTDRAS